MSTDPLNAQLLRQLECPVCLATCIPPIYMCINGHCVCAECQMQLNECGICRAPGKPTARCVQLEHMAALLKIPCANTQHGCTLAFNMEDMAKHMPNCDYGYHCHICERWKGSVVNLKNHVRSEHLPYFIKCPSNGTLSMWTRKPTTEEFHNTGNFRMFVYNDDLFWHEDKYHPRTRIYSNSMRIVSNKAEDASRYYFSMEFKCKSHQNKHTMSIHQAEVGNENSTSERMKIYLPVSIVQSYQDGKIAFILKISQSNLVTQSVSDQPFIDSKIYWHLKRTLKFAFITWALIRSFTAEPSLHTLTVFLKNFRPH